MMLTGKLFSIPPSAPFLNSLARAILAGRVPGSTAPPDPFDLARYEIYLPNRAACRSLAQIFLDLSPNRATLLPRIRPLGSAEEDELLLLQAEIDDGLFRDTDLPVAPAINAMERRLALCSLVLAWARQLRDGGAGEPGLRIADTPAAASEMALDLMRLMDEAETEGADLSRLAEHVPERFAEFEQLSLNFLNIVIKAWPAFLAERGLLNPADRRNRLMALETERLRRVHPETPVIIAGSTGSIPATAELMKVVTELPKGAIVVPDLDLALDDESWAALDQHPEHPQAGLFALLHTLGAARGDVLDLAPTDGGLSQDARSRFLSEAVRPSQTLARWPSYIASADREALREALKPVCLIEAPDEQTEAAAIAMVLREALETPGRTASLVTPDQALARRVSAELRRWDLKIANGNGEPLRTSSAGRFYELIADYAATGEQIALLALLKYPLTKLGLPKETIDKLVPLIEIAAIRQAWCGEGIERLIRSIELARKKAQRQPLLDQLADEDWEQLRDFGERIRTALSTLSSLRNNRKNALRQIAAAHIRAANAFAADETGNSGAVLENADGEAMNLFLSALAADVPGPELPLADYPAFLGSIIRHERTRPERGGGARIHSLTPVQARLTSADLVIIAGLNDGTWPEAADPGPWLNRATRSALGLPPPERKTRLAAHDFCQLFGAPEVVMSRALKVEGTPTVASRWLLRLQTLLKGLDLDDALAAPRPWLHWAAARNHAEPPPSAKAPAPCPPPAARPRSLTVSNIETLIANPYAIYASAILKLSPLNPLGADPGGAERGQIIHDVLHHFTNRFGAELPEDCAREFLQLFDGMAALYGDQAHIRAFWRPRLERFAQWFAETEPGRRGDALTLSEVRGSFRFMAPGGEFRLRARADRIDLHRDGSLAIYDYKSGEMPKEPAVASFKAPQLPLEALIALEAGFEGINSTRIARLSYISAKGGEPAGEQLDLKAQPADLAEGARDGLATLVAKFDDPSTPYPALRRSLFPNGYRYDPYAHLARVAEWAGEEDGEA